MSTHNNLDVSKTEFDTSTLHGLKNKSISIARDIESILLINKNNDAFLNISSNIIAVKGNDSNVDNFFHPIVYKDKVYLDIRNIVNKNTGEVSNFYDFSYLKLRAKLDLAWLENKESYFSQMNFIIDSFSSWFTYGIQRHLNASLSTTMNIRIVAAIYYLGYFNIDTFSSKDDLIAYILRKLPSIINIPAMNINDLFLMPELENELIHVYNLGTQKEYVDCIAELANVLTIICSGHQEITKGFILNSIVRGAVIANNAAEIASISIEHLPTFVSMLSLINSKGAQNNTSLGKAVIGISKKHRDSNFDRFINIINSEL